MFTGLRCSRSFDNFLLCLTSNFQQISLRRLGWHWRTIFFIGDTCPPKTTTSKFSAVPMSSSLRPSMSSLELQCKWSGKFFSIVFFYMGKIIAFTLVNYPPSFQMRHSFTVPLPSTCMDELMEVRFAPGGITVCEMRGHRVETGS